MLKPVLSGNSTSASNVSVKGIRPGPTTNARAHAVDQKTARLKGLRLAKESADREAAEATAADKRPAKPRKKQLIADPDEVKGG
jgi:hypothetical protein